MTEFSASDRYELADFMNRMLEGDLTILYRHIFNYNLSRQEVVVNVFAELLLANCMTDFFRQCCHLLTIDGIKMWAEIGIQAYNKLLLEGMVKPEQIDTAIQKLIAFRQLLEKGPIE